MITEAEIQTWRAQAASCGGDATVELIDAFITARDALTQLLAASSLLIEQDDRRSEWLRNQGFVIRQSEESVAFRTVVNDALEACAKLGVGR